MKITITVFKINRFKPDVWYLSNVSLKILSYFYKPKNMAILGCFRQFWHKKRLENRCFQACGRGIRTLPIYKIVDFEWVPNNLVTRFARNNASANPYFFAEEENRHLMVPVFLLAEV